MWFEVEMLPTASLVWTLGRLLVELFDGCGTLEPLWRVWITGAGLEGV